jgi:hypothetical protein
MVDIFDPACELLPPKDEGNMLVYCCPSTVPSLWPPPPSPLLKENVQYIQKVVWLAGGGGGLN